MKKIKILTPNGVEIKAIVIREGYDSQIEPDYVCRTGIAYGQNRLFSFYSETRCDIEFCDATGEIEIEWREEELSFGEILCDYVIIPELDKELAFETFGDIALEEVLNAGYGRD